MKTLRERFLQALTSRGYAVISTTSRKYVRLARLGQEGFLYLGKSGALRTGPTIAKSIPVSEKFKKQLLEEVPS